MTSMRFCCLFLAWWAIGLSVASAQNGRDGDPAVDGANGKTDGQRTIHLPEEASVLDLIFMGNSGTPGGHGGTGIDLNGDGVALGGYGGNGGEGESLYVISDYLSNAVQVQAIAGAGAVAGKGGASVGAPPRTGGNGGYGGNAVISIEALDFVHLYGVGGNGAEGFGYGRSGGIGGRASVSADLQDYFPGVPFAQATAYARAQGGRGGVGRKFAKGGSGGHAGAGFSGRRLGAESISSETLAFGGDGGDSEGNTGGRGGEAGVGLQWRKPLNASDYPETGRHRLVAQGGKGGNSKTNLLYVGDGGEGGNARMGGISPYNVPPADSEIQIQLRGGDGGNVAGHGAINAHLATGGKGGSVTDSKLFLDQEATGNEQARLMIDMQLSGGRGGDNVLGNGGEGGSIRTRQPFPLETLGDVESSVTATAGSGGRGISSGDGGDADVYLDYGNTQYVNGAWFGMPMRDLKSTLQVRGGNAGTVIGGSEDRGNGGAAIARHAVRGSGAISATGQAWSGRGKLGGNATALTHGISLGENAQDHVHTIAQADVNSYGESMVVAGAHQATAESRAVGGSSYATAISIGGWGQQRSSSSTAAALAISTKGDEAIAKAHSLARADNNLGELSYQNYAKSTAEAENTNMSYALATAEAQGHFSFGSSLAIASGRQATAEATVQTQTSARPHQARLSTRVAGDARELRALSEMGFRRHAANHVSLHDVSLDVDVHARFFLEGELESLEDIESSGLYSEFDFPGEVNVFHAGEMAFSSDGTRYKATTTLDSQQVIDSWEAEHSLYAFIYDLEGVDDGFESVNLSLFSSGNLIFDVSATDLASLQAGVNDRAWSLGDFAANDVLDLDFQVTVDGSYDGQFLHFRTAVAGLAPSDGIASLTAVPEPSSACLLGLASLMLTLGIRKRRVCC